MRYLKMEIGKPPVFLSCGKFISDGPWIHPARTIDSFEVIIGLKGRACVEQDGETHEIREGRMLLLTPGVPHAGSEVSKEEVEFFWMHFRPRGDFAFLAQAQARELLLPYGAGGNSGPLKDGILVPVSTKTENPDRLIIQCRQLLHADNAGYYTPYLMDYLLGGILIELTQQTAEEFRKKSGENRDRRIGELLEWLRIHPDREVSVRELAERFGFNPDYLERRFKRQTGVSVKRYIHMQKIGRAKRLLCDTSLGVKEIAYSLGFKDEKYFMKLFRSYEDLTPTQFRKSFYRTHLNNR